MSEEKRIKARVQNKRKTEAEWYLDVYDMEGNLREDAFKPLKGELIIFAADYSEKNPTGCKYDRSKFGDGITNVIDLPFTDEQVMTDLAARVQRMSEIDRASWEKDNSDIPDDWIDREVTFTIDVEAAKAAGYGDVLENITNTNQLTLTKPKGIGFVYDYNAKHSYRVYTELSRDRGTYNKIVTSTSGAPVFDPDGYDWAWSEYIKDANGNDTIKPANGAIPLYPKGKMNSIVLRQNNGNVSVPYVPHEGASAASKYYVDTQANESKTYTDTKGDEIKAYVDSKTGNYTDAVVETKTGNLIVLDGINPSTSNIAIHSAKGGTPIRVSGSNFAYEDTVVAKGSTSWYSSSILIYPPKGHKYILTCDFKKIAGTKIGIAVKPDDNSRDWYREIGISDTEGSLSLEVDVGAYKKFTSLKFYSNYSGSAIETECVFSNIVFRLADMEVEPGTKGIQSVNYTTNADGDVVVSVPEVSPMLIYNIDGVELSATYSKDINKHFTTIENVTELPTANINTNKIYNLFSATFIHNRHIVDNSKCYIVNSRPTIGEPATNLERNAITAYYDLSNGKVYGYLDETLAAGFSQLAGTTIVAGWYPAEQLLPIAGWSYAGIIDHIGKDPNDSTIRLLLEKRVYIYQNEWIELTNSVVEERLPTPDNNGHFAYTVQRRNGKDSYELHLISHSINDWMEGGEYVYPYQIPLRENGIIKAATPKENLDVANKKYVDDKFASSGNLTEKQAAQVAKINSTNDKFDGTYDSLNNKAFIPTALSHLTSNTNYRTVSDTEKAAWNNKLDKAFPEGHEPMGGKVFTPGWWTGYIQVKDDTDTYTYRQYSLGTFYV